MIRDLDDKRLGQNSDSPLSPLPCCLFLVPSFGTFLSASCWSSLLSFERLDGPGCWSSHRCCGVDGRRSRCRLVRMVLVERADEFSEVLDAEAGSQVFSSSGYVFHKTR